VTHENQSLFRLLNKITVPGRFQVPTSSLHTQRDETLIAQSCIRTACVRVYAWSLSATTAVCIVAALWLPFMPLEQRRFLLLAFPRILCTLVVVTYAQAEAAKFTWKTGSLIEETAVVDL
jgi:hypothetical protein